MPEPRIARPARTLTVPGAELREIVAGGRKVREQGRASVYELRDGRAVLAEHLGLGRYRVEVYGSIGECGC